MERAPVAIALLAALALAGCTGPPEPAEGSYAAMGFDGTTWPDLHGAQVTVLAYSSFSGLAEEWNAAFRNLTNATVVFVAEEDSGAVLQRAVREKGDPSFDVIYGVDNLLIDQAMRQGVFEPYQPVLGERIPPQFRSQFSWLATPVNHGFIAVNVDPRANLTVRDLEDVKRHADRFVTEDPRTSTPGLGFLLATVATYGEGDDYDYLDYWAELFRGGVLVTSGWTEAYVRHFTGGYGQFEEGFAGTRALVTSYTTSPAYEMYYGYETLNQNVLAPNATVPQIQTMGIANGTRNLAAAQAWIEFALTDAFQSTTARGEAVYPVVGDAGVREVFQGRDPAPWTFQNAPLAYGAADVERWVRGWTDAYERARSGG